MKRQITVLFAMILFLFCGCAKNETSRLKSENEFQVYYAYMTEFDASDGFYYTDYKGFLYYFDYHVKKESIVCNKSNCKHDNWNDDTLSEQRCSAYLGNSSTGFVSKQKLYIMEAFNPDAHQIRIVESDLDRTNQREVTILECDSIYSYAIKDGILYAVMNQYELEEGADGTIISGSNKTAVFCKINLSDGTAETLMEKKGFSSGISIMAAEGEHLYLSHNYFEKPFDGTNFKDAKQHVEYYKYSVKTEKLQKTLQELTDDQILAASMINGCLFAKTAKKERSMNEGEEPACELKKIAPETERMETLAYTTDRHMIFSDYAVYAKEGETDVFVYDFLNEKEIAVSGTAIQNFYPQYAAGPYLYGYLQEGQESSICFILYEDFIAGKDSFIKVHT